MWTRGVNYLLHKLRLYWVRRISEQFADVAFVHVRQPLPNAFSGKDSAVPRKGGRDGTRVDVLINAPRPN